MLSLRVRPGRALARLGMLTAAGGAVLAVSAATVSAAPALPAAVPAVPAGGTAAALSGTATGDTDGPCRYTATPDDPAVRYVPLPPDPRRTPDRGTVHVTLWTNHGRIGLDLNRALAPCTVQSFLHLVRHGFYNFTICHRETAYDRLKVLQCGDPSGTGEGGPGYSYRDELPTDLPPWPGDPTGVRRLYARGVLAMANAGPDTNGSQFFMVYGDSGLSPNYTIFGTVDATGLATLDRIAAKGIAPTPEDPAPVDGAPAVPVKIFLALRTWF